MLTYVNTTKVVIYVRVSSKEQVEGYSIGEQIERLKKYCEAMGWTIVETFVDPGYSGADTNRPAMKRLMEAVEKGGIDKVVVYKLDRLSRSQKDTLFLVEDVFLKHGTDFVSMSENFDTSTPFGKAMVGILSVFAQLERETIKERMTMGKEARAKEGKWNGGSTVPMGYTYNEDTELLEVNEFEKMQVLEAIDLFLKGTPIRTICNIFEDKGYKRRGLKGKTVSWEPKHLKYIFTSKVYIGYMNHHGEWTKAEHEPIISEETFNKMYAIMEERQDKFSEHKKKSQQHASNLGGFVYCKKCGARYGYNFWYTRTREKHCLYSCYSRSKKSRTMIKDPNCMNRHWKVAELDEIVFTEIRKLASHPDYVKEFRAEKAETDDSENKIAVIEKQIKELNNRVSKFMDLYANDVFTMEQVTEKVEPLNKQIVGLKNELISINSEPVGMSGKEAVEIAKTFEDVVERNDINEIRMLIESLIYYIDIEEENVSIHWKFA